MGPYDHIHSEHNEDIGLYSRRDELQDPNSSRERSMVEIVMNMEKPVSSSQIASNMTPNSSSGTSIERQTESSSRNTPLKLALPKPVASKCSNAPLFDAYLESSRLSDDDDDIQAAPAPVRSDFSAPPPPMLRDSPEFQTIVSAGTNPLDRIYKLASKQKELEQKQNPSLDGIDLREKLNYSKKHGYPPTQGNLLESIDNWSGGAYKNQNSPTTVLVSIFLYFNQTVFTNNVGHIQDVPPISTQFQFLTFLIVLSKKTRFAIKTQMVQLKFCHLDIHKIPKIKNFFHMLKKIVKKKFAAVHPHGLSYT